MEGGGGGGGGAVSPIFSITVKNRKKPRMFNNWFMLLASVYRVMDSRGKSGEQQSTLAS